MHEELIRLIREEFETRLQKKTGWGRNDLKVEFDAALVVAQARLLDSVPCLKVSRNA